MYNLKKILFCLLCALPFTNTVHAQQKEWKTLLSLLQKEAAYFEGKNGFIQLEKSDYNTFSVEKATVSDSLIVFGMWLRDRFGNENSEQYVEETIVLEPEPFLVSAEIFYDFSYYFKNFPDAQFLRLEFDKDFPMIDKVTNIYKVLIPGKIIKDLNSGNTYQEPDTVTEDRNEMEDTTTRVLLPIRAKNRTKILNAIDDYQRNKLKPQLDYETWH